MTYRPSEEELSEMGFTKNEIVSTEGYKSFQKNFIIFNGETLLQYAEILGHCHWNIGRGEATFIFPESKQDIETLMRLFKLK